jgi:Co/Zn/Cd efflux system component
LFLEYIKKGRNMEKTTFEIKKMDCPCEENLLRMKLDVIEEVKNLEFDIPNRKLTVYHIGNISEIESSINDLKLGDTLLSSETTEEVEFKEESGQRKLLWTVLAINFAFFLIEMSTGIISKSMGLVADSLDMLADSFVYGISLLAVGGTIARKNNVSKLAGYFQILLAFIGFIEVMRRFLGDDKMPDFWTMIIVSTFALIANGICLYLFMKSKSEESHMQASMIFTSNDIIINFGVIVSAVLVSVLNSNKPDLIVGAIVFILVIYGAIRILRLTRN